MSKQVENCKKRVYQMLRRHEPLFGGWRIVSFIGAGMFGCVFKMEREDMGKTFVSALKVIPLTRRIEGGEETIDVFQGTVGRDAREILHLYDLGGHQNVVGWHNHEVFHEREEDQVVELVTVMMDFLPNSLANVLKKGPVPWGPALKILVQCLRGLEHVHGLDIVHGDIKPDNIFIAERSVVKLGDFGVARKINEASEAQARVGTPMYVAPEVVNAPPGTNLDQRVDIYSLGMVGYEMLMGKLPFADECAGDKTQMFTKRMAGEPFGLRDEFPPGVRAAILGALAPDPEQRYATAWDLRKALEKAVNTGGSVTIRPDGSSTQRPAVDEAALESLPEVAARDVVVLYEGDDPPMDPAPSSQSGKTLSSSPQTHGRRDPLDDLEAVDPDAEATGKGTWAKDRLVVFGLALASFLVGFNFRGDTNEMAFVFLAFYAILPLFLAMLYSRRFLEIGLGFCLSLAGYNIVSQGAITNGFHAWGIQLLVALLHIPPYSADLYVSKVTPLFLYLGYLLLMLTLGGGIRGLTVLMTPRGSRRRHRR